MKMSILTLHRVKNYGSVLQAYATQVFFGDEGYQTEFIDYYRENDVDSYGKASLTHNIVNKFIDARVHTAFHRVLSLMVRIALTPSVNATSHVFDRFIAHRLRCTQKKYFSYEELLEETPNADVFCVGSDQVWNTVYNGGILPAYYLDFVPSEKTKISFASSIGMDRMPDMEKAKVRDRLSRFHLVSVREQSAVDMLDGLGISAKRIIDPTLLLPSDKWELLLQESKVRSPYLLVYVFGTSNDAERCIKDISRRMNLRVVRIGAQPYHRFQSGRVIVNPSIEEFLTLFYNAEYIITNSFHGTAFSVNFNKPFTVLLRDRFNSRILDFLKLVNLQDRVSYGGDNLMCNQTIDYQQVNRILDQERTSSRQYVRAVLGTRSENDK